MKDLSQLESFVADESMYAQASYSSLTLHRKCPQAWYYRHVARVEPLQELTSPYLVIGRWWSALRAAEALRRGRNAESLLELPRDMKDRDEGYAFDPAEVDEGDVLQAAEERWKRMNSEARGLFEEKLGATLPERLHGMYGMWDAAHSDRAEREQPLGVEMFWKRELPRPEGDLSWSIIDQAALAELPKMNLIGFLDYVYYDRQRKMVVVRDDKAPSDLGNATSAVDDLMDSQLMLYAWGITPKLKRLGADAPRAVSYDRVRSVAPKQPVLTAAGGLSKVVTAYDADTYRRWASADGRPSSEEIREIEIEKGMNEGGLQKVMDRLEPGPFWGTPGEFYASGAKKDQPKFGTYQLDAKVLEKLSTPAEQHRWVMRTFKPISRPVLAAHLRSAVDTALDIFQTQLRSTATGEAARNLDRRGCAQCDFKDLCRAQIIGGARGDYDLESFGLRERARHRPSAG